MNHVRKFLVPLGSLLLMVKQQLRVLLLLAGGLLVGLSLFIIELFPLFFQILLVISNFLIFLALRQLKLILQSSKLVRCLIKLLLQRGAVGDVILADQFEPLIQNGLFAFELLNLLVQV